MHDIVVIGCGNPLRGDDGAGWYAVDEIEKNSDIDKIRFLKCRELGPELSESLSRSRHALFIDVSVKEEGGVVREEKLLPSPPVTAVDAHSLEPESLLSLSEALYGHVPGSILLSVPGKSFGYEERISDDLASPLKELVERARSILDEWIIETDRERLISNVAD